MNSSIFSPENPVWNFFSTVADLVMLNILFLITCIPGFTIGASVTALYAIIMKIAQKSNGHLFQNYWHAFKTNFRQSTIIWIILLVFGSILGLDLYLVNCFQFPKIFNYIFLLLVFCLICIMSYIFPLQCKFINSVKNTFKNAFTVSIANLIPWTFLIVLLNITPIVVLYFYPFSSYFLIPFMFLLGFSGIAYLNSKIFNHIFVKYLLMIEEK